MACSKSAIDSNKEESQKVARASGKGFFWIPPPSKGMDLVFSAETQAIKKLVIETGLGCLSWPQPKLLKVEKEIASRNSQI